MNLNLLSPELQERLLFLEPVQGGQDVVTLKGLQEVCLEADWGRQRLRSIWEVSPATFRLFALSTSRRLIA